MKSTPLYNRRTEIMMWLSLVPATICIVFIFGAVVVHQQSLETIPLYRIELLEGTATWNSRDEPNYMMGTSHLKFIDMFSGERISIDESLVIVVKL